MNRILLFGLLLGTFMMAAPAKKVLLFNGKDLSGWKVFGTEKWYVDNGELICDSGPDKQYGYLATEEAYKNFDLSVQFKQEANGNSGVFFRSSIEGTKISGWQVEVAPKGHDTGGIYESYGREWLEKIPDEKETILKEGDWNTLRIRVDGDHVQTYLNGKSMVDMHDAKIGAANGSIALQIHSGGGIKVRWRKLVLKPL
ncbi:MAG: secreted glycosyl hydrolase [Spirosoma sp.]|nr:secreted glycosyl hydrolase [Spirosoma sp.]